MAAAQQTLLAGSVAASSTTAPVQSTLQQEVNRLRTQLQQHRAQGKAEPAPLKPAGKAGTKPAPKKKAQARKEARKTHVEAIKSGKCFKHNSPAGCKVYNCQYPHDCTVCGKEGCAAWKHKQ